MSDGNDVTLTPVREVEEYTYRKLIRPSLARTDARRAAGPVDDVHGEIRAEGRGFVPRPEPGNEILPGSRGNQRGRSESRQPLVMDSQPLTPDRGYSNRGVVHEPAQAIDANGGRRIPIITGPARPRSDGPASNGGAQRSQQKRAPRADNFAAKKIPPPEQTHAESFYYQKQMQARTVVVAVMQDGEELEGIIEWYDKNCIKMNRIDEPNVVIYKRNIKYLFKADEAAGE